MILKVKNLDNMAWNYFDNVKHVSVERGQWCFVEGENTDRLYSVRATVPAEIAVGISDSREPEKSYKVNTGVVSYCDYLFISYRDIRYNDPEKKGSIQTVDLIRFSELGSDEEKTIAVYPSTDAFLLNSEGKTIERII